MRILFVYNADSGLSDAAKDFATRIFAPNAYSCNLCRVTHGLFYAKTPWKNFLDTLPQEKIFLHRDEFKKKYPQYANVPLPAVLFEYPNVLEVAMSADEINKLKNWTELKDLISSKIAYAKK